MRKTFAAVLLTVVSLFGASVATAQERNVQGYVGVQVVRVNPDIRQPSFKFDRTTDTVGVNASVTGFVAESLGVTGEFGANFDGDLHDSSLMTGLGGLTLQARNPRFQPFVRGLGGIARVNADNELLSINTTDYSPAFAVGGGLDIKLSENIALRVIQADYLQTRAFDAVQHNLRLGVGLRF
jgi:opacity protein-like surface antigen